jgi:hypothetical protein
MNETRFAKNITRYLDRGLDLPAPTAARLAQSRQRALARQGHDQRILALPGGLELDFTDPRLRTKLFSALFALALVFGTYHWQQAQQTAQRAAELADIDVAMLSADLPLDAYLDQEFDEWVRRSRE